MDTLNCQDRGSQAGPLVSLSHGPTDSIRMAHAETF